MISHQRNTLHDCNFNKIIGIRDVHPDHRSQIAKIKMELPFRVPQNQYQLYFYYV
jgi:hypothetical protein